MCRVEYLVRRITVGTIRTEWARDIRTMSLFVIAFQSAFCYHWKGGKIIFGQVIKSKWHFRLENRTCNRTEFFVIPMIKKTDSFGEIFAGTIEKNDTKMEEKIKKREKKRIEPVNLCWISCDEVQFCLSVFQNKSIDFRNSTFWKSSKHKCAVLFRIQNQPFNQNRQLWKYNNFVWNQSMVSR